jgi:hypothetical protein
MREIFETEKNMDMGRKGGYTEESIRAIGKKGKAMDKVH